MKKIRQKSEKLREGTGRVRKRIKENRNRKEHREEKRGRGGGKKLVLPNKI